MGLERILATNPFIMLTRRKGYRQQVVLNDAPIKLDYDKGDMHEAYINMFT